MIEKVLVNSVPLNQSAQSIQAALRNNIKIYHILGLKLKKGHCPNYILKLEKCEGGSVRGQIVPFKMWQRTPLGWKMNVFHCSESSSLPSLSLHLHVLV